MKPLNPLFIKIDEMLCDEPERYITNQEILEAYDGKKFEHTARRTDTVKGHPAHQSLQDAMKLIKKVLKEQGLSLDFKNGKDASAGFRYPQGVDDPMKSKKTNHRQMRSAQLQRLVAASTGLFPSSWLADLLVGAQSMIPQSGKVIGFDQNLHLEHLNWIPTIFDAIEKCLVLHFCYNPRYGEQEIPLLFHPYYLKEYNQRWFVFGYATDMDGKPQQYSCCAIDRIVGEISVRDDEAFHESQSKGFASDYFKDIVGVTRPKNKKPDTILIATNDAETHSRIMTKPIHAGSQRQVTPFSKDFQQRGIISITVIPNNELDTLLLSYGAGIEVLKPQKYRDHFIQKVKALSLQYEGNL